MKITYFEDYTTLSLAASQIMMEVVKVKSTSLICAATGASPSGLYKNLEKEFTINQSWFDFIRILKLDEWGGIPMSDPNSCHSYLLENIINPLQITADRFIAFNSDLADAYAECERIQKEINLQGPIDCCILGLGKNGHLGFNEPSDHLHNECHVAELSAVTMQHSMIQSMPNAPTFGMTVGMRDILNSQKVILIITGKEKREAIKQFLKQKISRQLPASFLWLHQNVECLIDKKSC